MRPFLAYFCLFFRVEKCKKIQGVLKNLKIQTKGYKNTYFYKIMQNAQMLIKQIMKNYLTNLKIQMMKF